MRTAFYKKREADFSYRLITGMIVTGMGTPSSCNYS